MLCSRSTENQLEEWWMFAVFLKLKVLRSSFFETEKRRSLQLILDLFLAIVPVGLFVGLVLWFVLLTMQFSNTLRLSVFVSVKEKASPMSRRWYTSAASCMAVQLLVIFDQCNGFWR